MPMPNFLVIGAPKCGTTSLWHYLRQHPDIYMSPVKEPFFLATPPDGVQWSRERTDLDAYRSLFDGVNGEKAIGEATPNYLYNPASPERIRRYVPDAKLIAVLRQPAERAYSHFLYNRAIGIEPERDFCRALDAEAARCRGGWSWGVHYRGHGFYHRNLARYVDWLADGKVAVFLHEDLHERPGGVLREIFRFLQVDEHFVADVSIRHGVTAAPRLSWLHGVLRGRGGMHRLKHAVPRPIRRGLARSITSVNQHRPTLQPSLHRELTEEFRDDILELQKLLGRDLTSWLGGSPV